MALAIYKRSQGTYTRLCSAFGAALIFGIGCWKLFEHLEASDFGLGSRAELWLATLVPFGLFSIFGLTIFWLVNKPGVADFMISAEGELKKVSWSSRQEVVVSTFIVIVVVAVLACLLGGVDVLFELFFSELIGI